VDRLVHLQQQHRVQAELRELRATLSPVEKSVVTTKPTDNPEAYLLYLRAREIENRFVPPEEADSAVRGLCGRFATS
jgi:hypothetical protein